MGGIPVFVPSDGLAGAGAADAAQLCALDEDRVSHRNYLSGDDDGGEGGALLERTLLDGGYTVRNCEGG